MSIFQPLLTFAPLHWNLKGMSRISLSLYINNIHFIDRDFFMATPTDTITAVVDKDAKWYSLIDGATPTLKKISKSSLVANEHRLFYGFQINGWEQANMLVNAATLKDSTPAKTGGDGSSVSSISSTGEEEDEEEDEEDEDA